jgi:sugar phosphate isomerase/epimerase
MIEEILQLGFDTLELSHGIRSSQLEGILQIREMRKFHVSSVHNFMPMPVEVQTDSPDCYEFTSDRATDRDRALKLTLSTIDWASKLEAPFVVVHTGRIRSLNLTEPLCQMVDQGKLHSREYIRQKLAAVQAREKVAEAFNSRVLEILREAADHAGNRGVQLGVENREYYEAVPSEREMPSFFQRLDSKNVGYWHDFGHAQIKENLSLIDHRLHLETMAPRLLGCHIHDTRWPFKDHCPPFTGETRFDELVPLLPKKCAMVLEMSPRAEAADIVKAAETWEKKFR